MRIIRLLSIALCAFPAAAFGFSGISKADTKGFVSCKEAVVYKEAPLFAGDRTLLGKLSRNTSVSISEETSGEYLVSGGGLHGYIQTFCVTLGTPAPATSTAATKNKTVQKAQQHPATKESEEEQWERASKLDSVDGYLNYYKQFPDTSRLAVLQGTLEAVIGGKWVRQRL